MSATVPLSKKPAIGNYNTLLSEASTSLVDLFSDPVAETALAHSPIRVSYPPLVELSHDENQSVEFHIPSDPNRNLWIIPGLSRLTGKAKIVKLNGEAIAADEQFAWINMAPTSFFKDIRVDLQGSPLGDVFGSNNSFQSYLEFLLTFNEDVKVNNFPGYWWSGDTVGKIDTFDDTNAGFKERKAWALKEREFSIIPPHFFSHLAKLIHPSCDLRFILKRNTHQFLIQQPSTNTNKYGVEISQLRLELYKVRLTPSVSKGIETKLARMPMKYPTLTPVLKTYPLAQNSSVFHIPNILNSRPSSLLICFTSTDRYFGDHKSPWKFETFNLQECALFLNNVKLEPSIKLDGKASNEDSQLLGLYANNMSELGFLASQVTNGVTFEQFKNQSFFIYQDYSLDKSNCSYQSYFADQGQFSLELKFGTALPKPVTCLILAHFSSVLQINDRFEGNLIKY